MQVIGICRFSYPGLGGFQTEQDSLEARTAYLYAKKRLEERFRFFETFTLPAIRAQFDPDFTFLIVIGDSLPDMHRRRLESLVKDVPQIVIQAHPPGKHRDVMAEAINSLREPTGEPCLQFRLDDDDAVAFSYVHKLRKAARDVSALLNENRHIAIDFNQGYIATPGASGIAATAIQKPYWTPGLALMFRPGISKTVMNFGHHTVHKKMPTVTFTGEDMMLRGFNKFNDSRQGPEIKTPQLKLLDAEGELHFKMTYGIDAGHVRQVFSEPV